MQRDDEAPREISKSFTTSRAELTLQPERSGHYVFTFIAISDANYRKVELQGPSIDQMIHPLASADFSESHGSGRGKRIVNTCSGDTVDIDVDLKVSLGVHSTWFFADLSSFQGTGPWNLELQVIGPHTAETMQLQAIRTSKKTIQVPIPQELQKDGGTFEIDIGLCYLSRTALSLCLSPP